MTWPRADGDSDRVLRRGELPRSARAPRRDPARREERSCKDRPPAGCAPIPRRRHPVCSHRLRVKCRGRAPRVPGRGGPVQPFDPATLGGGARRLEKARSWPRLQPAATRCPRPGLPAQRVRETRWAGGARKELLAAEAQPKDEAGARGAGSLHSLAGIVPATCCPVPRCKDGELDALLSAAGACPAGDRTGSGSSRRWCTAECLRAGLPSARDARLPAGDRARRRASAVPARHRRRRRACHLCPCLEAKGLSSPKPLAEDARAPCTTSRTAFGGGGGRDLPDALARPHRRDPAPVFREGVSCSCDPRGGFLDKSRPSPAGRGYFESRCLEGAASAPASTARDSRPAFQGLSVERPQRPVHRAILGRRHTGGSLRRPRSSTPCCASTRRTWC